YLYASARRFADADDRAEAERLADTALHQVGLSLAEVRGRFPHELSGGQLQRAAIARALISRPSLIVAAEAVSMIHSRLRATRSASRSSTSPTTSPPPTTWPTASSSCARARSWSAATRPRCCARRDTPTRSC